MKRVELETLIRSIVQSSLNELSTLSSSDMTKMMASNPELDPTVPTDDAMTSAEKARMERDADRERRKAIRTADMKLKSVKTQSAYYKQQEKQNKLDIISKEKELQNLKANKSISSGGAGSISST